MVDARRMVVFLGVPLIVLVAVSVASAVLTQRLSRSEALDQAKESGRGLSKFVIAPVLGRVLDGAPGAREELDRRVQDRLGGGLMQGVLIWRPPGQIVYTSSPGLDATTPGATRRLRAAAEHGRSSAILDSPPTTGGAAEGDLRVEVYTPLSVAGSTVAVETFLRSEGVEEDAALLFNRVVLVTVGGLVVLQLVQVPLGLSLFRRVRRQDAERADLLARSLTASDQERRAIAADVHDGPVQDLAGVGYALGSLQSTGPPETRSELGELVTAVRDAVARLRRLMVDVYPPDLSPGALDRALTDLAETVRSTGTHVTLEVEPVPEVSSSGTAVLYRTAKEALSEEWCAATAHDAWVRYWRSTLRGRPAVRLEVGHDCVLPPPGSGAPRGNPEEALRLIRAQIADLGGTLHVITAGQRTVLTAVLPTASEPSPPDQRGWTGGWRGVVPRPREH